MNLPTNQLRLKTKLMLKHLKRKMDAEAEENFGYAQDTEYFNSLIYKINRYEEIARTKFPDLYLKHINSF